MEVFFIETPPNRIILEIKKTENFYCSIGWFKNPDRENFAKFSLPIYQNKPVVILTNKKQRHLFSPYKTLKEVFSDKSLIMATMSAFSYGTFIDKLMKDDFPKTHEISSKQELLPTLIMSGRVAYMLIAPEEIEALVRSPGLNPADFVSVTMSDIPTGNKRYLMFSKGVSDGIIERINLSVRKFVNPDIFEKGSENFYPEKSTN